MHLNRRRLRVVLSLVEPAVLNEEESIASLTVGWAKRGKPRRVVPPEFKADAAKSKRKIKRWRALQAEIREYLRETAKPCRPSKRKSAG